jgi:hypothetical protein
MILNRKRGLIVGASAPTISPTVKLTHLDTADSLKAHYSTIRAALWEPIVTIFGEGWAFAIN